MTTKPLGSVSVILLAIFILYLCPQNNYICVSALLVPRKCSDNTGTYISLEIIDPQNNTSANARVVPFTVRLQIGNMDNYHATESSYSLCVSMSSAASDQIHRQCNVDISKDLTVTILKEIETEFTVSLCKNSSRSLVGNAATDKVDCICQDSVFVKPSYKPRCIAESKYNSLLLNGASQLSEQYTNALFQRTTTGSHIELFFTVTCRPLEKPAADILDILSGGEILSILSIFDSINYYNQVQNSEGVLALNIVTNSCGVDTAVLPILARWISTYAVSARDDGETRQISFLMYACPSGIEDCLVPTILGQDARFLDDTMIIIADTKRVVYEKEFLAEVVDVLHTSQPCFVTPYSSRESTHLMLSHGRLHHYTVGKLQRAVRWTAEMVSSCVSNHQPTAATAVPIFSTTKYGFAATSHTIQYFSRFIGDDIPFNVSNLINAAMSALDREERETTAMFVAPWPTGAHTIEDVTTMIEGAKIMNSRLGRLERLVAQANSTSTTEIL